MDRAEEGLDDDHNPNEDSMLLDGLNTNRSKDGNGNKDVFEKLKKAEKLLITNLEAFSNQKKFYEEQIQSLESQLSEANTSVESLNAQIHRDKMKFKLREDKITKLEQEHSITPEESEKLLLQEIEVLKNELEAERHNNSNPKIAKLSSELKQMTEQKKQFENELKPQLFPKSVHKQLQEQGSLIDNLTDYLKTKVSQEALEMHEKTAQQLIELKKNARIQEEKQILLLDDLQQEYDILIEQNVKQEEETQRLTRELGKAKVENKSLSSQILTFQENSDRAF